MTRKRRKWSDEDIKILMSDLPAAKIADLLDMVCEESVRYARYNMRHKIPDSLKVIGPFSDDENQRFINYRQSGKSLPYISVRMKRSVIQLKKQSAKLRSMGISLERTNNPVFQGLDFKHRQD